MKSLYYSNLVSDQLYIEICTKTGIYSSQAIQKFHRLLSEGLANVMELYKISSLPITGQLKDKVNIKKYLSSQHYLTSSTKNTKMRQMSNFIISFWHTLFQKNVDFAFFDYLNFTVSLGGWLACKLKGIETVLIVTDLPDLMVHVKTNLLNRCFNDFKYFWMSKFDRYILLTEAMSEVVNLKQKPYIVIEGLVDSKYHIPNVVDKKNIVLYAGGLYEKYGVKKLIEAFLTVDLSYELHLYGSGDLENYILETSKSNPKIKFFGSVENKVVVEKLPFCSLLVNPRPSSLELSKYSFPSKNLEYMLSGTPLLTTPLPGIPKNHHPFVYFFEDESEMGFQNKLKEILSKPKNELSSFGYTAQSFVLTNKSDKVQGQKILNFVRV